MSDLLTTYIQEKGITNPQEIELLVNTLSDSTFQAEVVAAARQAGDHERFIPYRYNPEGYINDILGFELWDNDTPNSQAKVAAAHTLALRQQHERYELDPDTIEKLKQKPEYQAYLAGILAFAGDNEES